MATSTERYVARFQFISPVRYFLPMCWVLALAAGAVAVYIARGEPGGSFADAASLWAFLGLCAGLGLLFAAMALGWTVAIVKKKVALALDADGVTLGRMPFPPGRVVTVPWTDVDAIVLYDRHMTDQGMVPHVGMRLRDGAVRPPGVPQPGSVLARLNRHPAEVRRQIKGWRLDGTQLINVTRAYAPHVRLVAADGSDKQARHARVQDLMPKRGHHWYGWNSIGPGDDVRRA